MAVRITIENVRSGQPRAYADSVLEQEIFIETKGWNKTEYLPYEGTAERAEEFFKQYIPELRRPRRKDAGMLQSYLQSFTAKVGYPGYFALIVVSPFTD